MKLGLLSLTLFLTGCNVLNTETEQPTKTPKERFEEVRWDFPCESSEPVPSEDFDWRYDCSEVFMSVCSKHTGECYELDM